MEVTYRTLLLEEFEERIKSNPSYSLRSFARDLSLSPSRLSEALNGKKGISATKAQEICHKLQFNEEERDLFVALVEAEHARSPVARKLAMARVAQKKLDLLPLESFRVIANWIHFAILELCEVEGFLSDSKWIANRLKAPQLEIDQALERLFHLNLLTKNEKNQWVQTHKDLATPTDIPSKYIRAYHRQILKKAEDSLEQDSVGERDITSIVFALNSSELSWAKEQIKIFRRNLTQKMQSSPTKDRVYGFSVQLIPLDRIHKEEM